MIGLAMLGYVAVIVILGLVMGPHLRRQRERAVHPEIEAVRDEQLDIKTALKRGGVK